MELKKDDIFQDIDRKDFDENEQLDILDCITVLLCFFSLVAILIFSLYVAK